MKNSKIIIKKVKEIAVQIIDGDRGKNYPKDSDFMDDGYCLFLNAGNVTNKGFSFNNCEFISFDKDQVLRKGKLKKYDLVMTTRGTLGNIAYFNNRISFRNIRINSGMVIFRANSNKILPSYFYYNLNSPYFYKQVEMLKTGVAQPQLPIRDIKNIKIILHQLDEQKKIASILSTYDDLIDINQKRIHLLEQAARLLYREWFVYFRFPGHENVKIIDGIPEGWKKKSLSEIVTTQYGYTETATQDKIGPKFLRGKDINKSSYIDWNSVPYCSDKKLDFNKYYLSPGDILIIRMADPGKVGIVEKEIKAIFASYLVRLKIIDKNIPPYFLFYSLVSNRYQGYINGASTGSTRKSASAKLMVTYDLLIPKKEIINSFNEQMIQLRRSINILLEQNQKLAQARDLLLPRLMSGKIDVFDFDKDNIPVESEVEKIVN